MKQISLDNSEQVISSVSESITALAKQCITDSGKFTIALSGGNTPKKLYQHLIKQKCFDALDTHKMFFYLSDERYVALDDERSNYGLAEKYLFNFIGVSFENKFPVDVSFEKSAESAAHYQEIILKNINNKNSDNIPQFDLIILGMGEDGHTASLFPESELLHEQNKLVGSCYHKESNTERISFTFPLINAAKNVYVITLGTGKYKILQSIKKCEQNNEIFYPIQQVKPQGDLLWYLDKAADLGD